jgi:alkyldihydroxyacetonephosphate synthase
MSYRFAEYFKPGGTFGDAVTLDTMEVAGTWRGCPDVYTGVRAALQEHVDLVLAHVSHAYPTGACIYFTLGAVNDGDETRRSPATTPPGTPASARARCRRHGVAPPRGRPAARPVPRGGTRRVGLRTSSRRIKDALDPDGLPTRASSASATGR